MATLNPVYVGVDIGQVSDPTAIAVIEGEQLPRGRQRLVGHTRAKGYRYGAYGTEEVYGPEEEVYEPLLEAVYTVRHIERLPLGTGYPAVARRVADILVAEPLRPRERHVFIDVTGVGRPVFELIVEEVHCRPNSLYIGIWPITFTHGDKYDAQSGSLGKAYLVSRLQSLLQREAIHAPDTPEVRQMVEELKVYEIKVDLDGKDTYGAFRVGKHDDLVTALGLATLTEPPQPISPYEASLFAELRDYRGW